MNKMPEPFKVKVTLVSNLKGCHMGSKVGDSWIVQEGRTPDRPMCLKIFYDLQQSITSLHLEELGAFGDVPEGKKHYIHCVAGGANSEPSLVYEVTKLV